MSTALTVYLNNTAATTVTTSDGLVTTAPAAEVNSVASTLPLSTTGYIELVSQGAGTVSLTAGTPTATVPAASGKGWLFDVTTLEGNQLAAGTYTPALKVKSQRAITATIYLRLFKRSSAGAYTSIGMFTSGSMALAAVTITTVTGWSTLTTGSPTAFVTGDKFYADVVINVTTATAQNNIFAVLRNAGANESIATPGYDVTPTGTKPKPIPTVPSMADDD